MVSSWKHWAVPAYCCHDRHSNFPLALAQALNPEQTPSHQKKSDIHYHVAVNCGKFSIVHDHGNAAARFCGDMKTKSLSKTACRVSLFRLGKRGSVNTHSGAHPWHVPRKCQEGMAYALASTVAGSLEPRERWKIWHCQWNGIGENVKSISLIKLTIMAILTQEFGGLRWQWRY